ncbi:hypothetical protein BM527_04550 [Alteromonas sp. Mex14]|nr:hypothetical protein BM527_04550 [Alteromonas sp. Mex14]
MLNLEKCEHSVLHKVATAICRLNNITIEELGATSEDEDVLGMYVEQDSVKTLWGEYVTEQIGDKVYVTDAWGSGDDGVYFKLSKKEVDSLIYKKVEVTRSKRIDFSKSSNIALKLALNAISKLSEATEDNLKITGNPYEVKTNSDTYELRFIKPLNLLRVICEKSLTILDVNLSVKEAEEFELI